MRGSKSVADDNEDWLRSPFYHLLHGSNAAELRRPLDGSYRRGEFPLLDRFQDEGSTDYLALAIDYRRAGAAGAGARHAVLVPDRSAGRLQRPELELLRRLSQPLALAYQADRSPPRRR